MYEYEYDMAALGAGIRDHGRGGHFEASDLESVNSRQSYASHKSFDLSRLKKFASVASSKVSTAGSLFCLFGNSVRGEPSDHGAHHKGIVNKLQYNEHKLTLEELADSFGTHINEDDPISSMGLSAQSAKARQDAFGYNVMSSHEPNHPLLQFLLQFTDTFMLLLQVAAFLSLLSWTLESDPVDLYIGVFLLGAVFLQCIATYRQESKSDELMEKFRLLAPQHCVCIREGVQLRLTSENLVVGDVIKLYSGVKVPSDCRLIHISSGYVFRVDQSSITGENEPVECHCAESKENNVLDAYNVIFGGSLVVEGEGLAVVIRSGDRTLLGQMVSITGDVEKAQSTLKKDIAEFVWVVARLSVGMGVMVFLLGIYRGLPVIETLMDGLVVTIIANLPCGLPATVTACLLIVAERLRSNNVFIKRLDGIETLGACSLICTDKTGTLTQNAMSVSHAWVIEDNNSGVFIPQVTSLMGTEKFAESCSLAAMASPSTSSGGVSGRVESLSEESQIYRIKSNGMSDLSASLLLLKLATLNTRVSLTAQEPTSISMNTYPSSNEDFETSRRGLLSDMSIRSSTSEWSYQTSHHAAGPVMQPTGDATEVGIYKFCQHVTSVCYRYTHQLQEYKSGKVDSQKDTVNPMQQNMAPARRSDDASHAPRDKDGLKRQLMVESRTGAMFPSDNIEQVRRHYEKMFEVPFNSLHKWQMSVHDTGLDLFDITEAQPAGSTASSKFEIPRQQPSGSDSVSSGTEHKLNTSKGFSLRKNPIQNKGIADSLPSSLNSQTRSGSIRIDSAVEPYPEFMCVKGAPDILLPKCSHFVVTLKGGKGHRVLPIDPAFTSCLKASFEEMAAQGERALAYAMKWMPQTVEDSEEMDPDYKKTLKDSLIGKSKLSEEKNLCFVGLLSLIDPPRKEVPAAIETCAASGIQVVMVTGDYPTTAQAIARKIGLMTFPTKSEIAIQKGIRESEVPDADVRAVTIHGNTIDSMTEEDWQRIVSKDQIVFARTSPDQKLTIVQHFLNAGHVVAMTGDGINDSPALKQASIGIAMGITGSDIAREAADIVLLDDNFASIVFSIKEGRLLFDNLKKSIAYTLSHLLPQVFPIFLHFAFGWPLGLPPVLALCIDLVTEVFPATAFAYETAEMNIMNRPPRNIHIDRMVGAPLLFYAYVVAGVFEALGCMLVYFQAFNHYGFSSSFLVGEGSKYFLEDSPDVIIDVRYNDEANDDVVGDFNGYHKTYTAEEQMQILHRVQSAYFIAIIIIQAFHIFEVRARSISIFSRGVLGNFRLILGVFIALAIGCAVVFLHVAQFDFLETENPPADAIAYGCLVAVGLLYGYNEWRKYWLGKLETSRNTIVDERTGATYLASSFRDPTNKNHRMGSDGKNAEASEESTCEVLLKW